LNFQILPSSHINAELWNKTIQVYQSDVYNDYHYLNATTGSNWQGIIWGDYDKVLPFYQKKKWNIIPYVCMPPYVQKFDSRSLSEVELSEAISYFKKNNLIVDFRVNDPKHSIEFIKKQNFILHTKSHSFEKLEANFPSLLRKNILKAHQYLDIDIHASQQSITSFLKSNDLFNQLNKNCPWILDFPYGKSVVARYKGTNEIVAVLFFILYNNKAYLIAPYTSPKGKNTQAMTGLILNLIQDKTIDYIDFEGSSIESIAQFYEQFGAQKEIYYSLNWKKFGFL
jgi:hypothetical protein